MITVVIMMIIIKVRIGSDLTHFSTDFNSEGVQAGKERQPFPRLGEMQSALPRILPPLGTVRSGLGGVQEQGGPSTTPESTTSLTRVPKFRGTFDPVKRLEN